MSEGIDLTSIIENIHKSSIEKDFSEINNNIKKLEIFLKGSEESANLAIDSIKNLLQDDLFIECGGAFPVTSLYQSAHEDMPKKNIENILPIVRVAYEEIDKLDLSFIKKIYFKEVLEDELNIENLIEIISIKLTPIRRSCFPDDYYNFMVELFNDKIFKLENSSSLPFFIMVEWNAFSEAQIEKLLPVLENSYEGFKDWMSQYLITGILGAKLADERAFNILLNLKNVENELPRSLVSHGLEELIRNTKEKMLADKAYAVLLEMRNDPSELVQDEVEEAIQNISKV